MTYNAKTNRVLMWLFLVLTIPSFIPTNFSNGLLFFPISICVFIIMAISIQFKLRIEEEYLSYQIALLTFSIYEKVIYPDLIIRMNCKRFGWMTKGILIQTRNGFNIRIVDFEPNDVIEALLLFAIENDISISKSKDYLLLEK